ncbi:PepSY domain-containing protein [Paracoccus methylovorus]|uniref:PepSY domain-containing protein n=1 Tax=Paracoccus methylovorus TaxID=2812658 RepID=A0ABX7JEI6_9RHOB|nr:MULTISPECIES: PepSY domain-containing protein [Paracoccus]QRZ12124.1 PepSY domain-containing protein [Paracoccus methylovorus]
MKRLRIILLPLLVALALALALPTFGDDDRRHDHDAPWPEDWATEFESLKQHDFRVLPLKRAVEIAGERFRGRLIAARIVPPRPDERARGVILVHELRLLTPKRDVLMIRLDAHSGDFLEVAGAGLTDARRKDDKP